MSTKETLIKKLKDKDARVGILGLGYVGLPLAVVFAEAGFHVTGIDPDSRKVDSLAKGISYIPDVKTETVEKLVKSGQLSVAVLAMRRTKPCACRLIKASRTTGVPTFICRAICRSTIASPGFSLPENSASFSSLATRSGSESGINDWKSVSLDISL
jgi:hypothetical protein